MVCLENQETKKTMGDLCSTRSTKLGACIPSGGEFQCPSQILQLKQKDKSCTQKKVIELFFLHTLIGKVLNKRLGTTTDYIWPS
jgi:hypothetical protein